MSSPQRPWDVTPIPVFICGCQRSGTTFLGSLLGKRLPSVVTPESRFFSELLGRARNMQVPFDAAHGLAFVRGHWRFRIWEIDDRVAEHEEWLVRATTPGDLVRRIVGLYAAAHGVERPAYWIDHTPENVRYASTLARAFPEGRFIHLVRDGRAVAHSVLRLPWGPVNAEEAASWWALRVGFGLAFESALGERAIRARFENVVGDTEGEVRRLLDFLGVSDVGGAGLSKGFAVPAYTREQHALVNQAPQTARIDAWRTDMPAWEVDWFQRNAFDFLAYLGYEPLPVSSGTAARRHRVVSRLVRSPARRLQRRVRRLTVGLRA